MRFWDSSAIVPILVLEKQSAWARDLLRDDPVGIIWALTPVEVHSALVRRRRERSLVARDFTMARSRAKLVYSAMAQIVVLEQVAERALRVLDLHTLRAADALQLAAALVASRERPQDLPFVTLDEHLAEAAEREGFPLVSPKV
jgi:predicted nucleic acid-binding protein